MILFLHGPDTYRSRQKLKEIQDKFKREVDPQGYNLVCFDGKNTTIPDILKALSTAPFMAAKRMVVVEEYSLLKAPEDEKGSLADLCKSLLDDETIFVVWEGKLKKTDAKKDPVFKKLFKSPYIMEFAAWSDQEVAGWMAQEFQKEGVPIDGQALQYLASAIGKNQWRAATEVAKIAAYTHAKGLTLVDINTVKLLINAGIEDDIFGLVDAVSQKQVRLALEKLHKQYRAGSHELQILTMLFRQYRLLQQVRDGLSQGKAPDMVAKEFGIHPYVVKKMSGQARAISAEDLVEAYTILVETDRMMKSSGKDGKMLLSYAVSKLSFK